MSRGTKIIIGIVIAIVVIAGIWYGVSRKPATTYQKPVTQEPIKIGAILPLSGYTAFIGEPHRNGLELALKEINEQGGVNGRKIKIIYEDSEGDAQTGAAAAQKLINVDHVNILISSLTGVSSAIAPITSSNKKLLLYYSVIPTMAKESSYIFRDYVDIEKSCRALAQLSLKRGIEKVGFLRVEGDWTQLCYDAFKSEFLKNGKQTFDEKYSRENKDFRTPTIKLKEKKVDGIFLVDYPNYYPLILEQMHLLYSPKLIILSFGADPTAKTNFTYSLFKMTPTITFYPFRVEEASLGEKTKSFIARYTDKYNINPNYNAVFPYDDLHILVKAMKKCKNPENVNCLREKLSSINYDGVMGKVKFDSEGNSIRKVKLLGSLVYNDPEHLRVSRIPALKKIKAVWNESRQRSKIKVMHLMGTLVTLCGVLNGIQ